MSQRTPTDIEINTYAESFVLHGDQSRAWRTTFTTSKAKDEVVYINASNMHKLHKVRIRIEEINERLRSKSEVEFDISVSDIKKMLLEAAQGGLKQKVDAQGNEIPNNLAGAVSAISEINRMDGNHYQYKSDEENRDTPQPLVINFEVSPAIKEVKVTNART